MRNRCLRFGVREPSKSVLGIAVRHDQVRRQRHAGGAERPDMQIVHIRHAALAGQK